MLLPVCLVECPVAAPLPLPIWLYPCNRLFSSSDLPSKGSSKQPKSLLSRPPPPPTQSSSANRGFAGRGATTPEPPTTPSSGPGTLRVHAQTTYNQENLAFCFKLCTVTHLVGFLPLPWFSCSLVFFPYSWISFEGFFMWCIKKKVSGLYLFVCFLAIFNFDNMFKKVIFLFGPCFNM